MNDLLVTNLLCSSVYTSYAFAAQIIIYPLLHEKWYEEHQERAFKSYIFFLLTELVTSVMLAIETSDMIVPLVLLLLCYIPIVLIFRYETKFMSHIINEDFDWFRRYGNLRCVLCFLRWTYLYVYVLIT